MIESGSMAAFIPLGPLFPPALSLASAEICAWRLFISDVSVAARSLVEIRYNF